MNQLLRSRWRDTRFKVAKISRGQCFFDLQRAGLAVGVYPIPVEESESCVAVLLNLNQEIAGTDRMQATAWSKNSVTGVHPQRMHQLESAATADGLGELRLLNSTLQAKMNRSAGNSREDVPHLGLAPHAIAGVHLERKRFTSIEQFRQDRETRGVIEILAKNFHAMVSPKLMQRFSRPWTLPNDALRLRAIDELPRFANIFARRQFLSEASLQFAPAPNSLHQNRLKGERLGQSRFHLAARVTREARFVRQASPTRVRGLNFRAMIKPWVPPVLWMAVMFFGSTDLMSAEHTSRFLAPVLRWFVPEISPGTIAELHFYLRKAVHLTEYAILTGLIFHALRWSMPTRWKRALITLIAAVLFASADEFHQSLVISRSSSLGDVIIDTCGVLLALVICLFVSMNDRTRERRL
jgi:VanZ family protein